MLKIRSHEHPSFNTESMSPTLFKILNQNKYDSNLLLSGVIFLGGGCAHQIDVKYILDYWWPDPIPFCLNLSILRSLMAKDMMSFTIVGPQPWWEESISLHLKRTLLTRFPWWAPPSGYLLYGKTLNPFSVHPTHVELNLQVIFSRSIFDSNFHHHPW